MSQPADAQDLSTLLQAKSKHAARLEQRFSDAPAGAVRVIVRHTVDGAEAGSDVLKTLATPFGAQRIQAEQDGLLATHVGPDPSKSQRWQTRRIGQSPFMAMTVTAAEAAALVNDPRVVEVFEDRMHTTMLDQSVPLIGMTQAETGAYALGGTGIGTAIAIVDSGVDKTHPFLANKVIEEACFSTTTSFGTGLGGSTSVCPNGGGTQIGVGAGVQCSITGCDHGTHVAGIAAGKAASGSPTQGVAREAKIIAVQVFSRIDSIYVCPTSAPCLRSYESDVLAALDWLKSRVGNVTGGYTLAAINMSLGGGSNISACDSDSRANAIFQLRSLNVATVIASGNDGSKNSVSAPGCISAAVTVGSTTKADVISSFSNSGSMVDLLAPGSAILSSVPGGGYASFNGTSMATPHVAGAFAAMRSKLQGASVNQIESALKITGMSIADTRTGGLHTKPRINVDKALAELLSVPAGGEIRMYPASALTFTSSGPQGGPFPTTSDFYLVNYTPISWNGSMSSSGSNLKFFQVYATSYESYTSFFSMSAGDVLRFRVKVDGSAQSLPQGTYPEMLSVTLNGPGGNSTVTLGTGTATLTVTPPVPPANNNFAAAAIATRDTSVNFKTWLSTRELGEPMHFPGYSGAGTVWFKYTPTMTGRGVFSVSGQLFSEAHTYAVAAYAGPSVNRLVQLASGRSSYSNNTNYASAVVWMEAGKTYHFAVDVADTAARENLTYYLSQQLAGSTPGLFAAVLPYARAVQVGTTATAFANIINTATTYATCSIQMPADMTGATPGTFFFRGVTEANQIDDGRWKVNGTVQIPAGATQNFVFGFTPSAAFAATELKMLFGCDGFFTPVISYNGVNTFILSASATPVPDLVAIGATTSGDGIVSIPGNTGSHFFAASAVNIGASGAITASVDDGGKNLPITVTLCRTIATTGACVIPAAPAASTTSTLANNEVATYAIFVTGRGNVAFDPAHNRLFLRLKDAGGVTRGATNVAVRTTAATDAAAASAATASPGE